MRSAKLPPTPPRAMWPAMMVLVSLAALAACDSPAQRDASIAVADAAAHASLTPAAATPSTFEADDALATATARDQSVRAAREQTLRVQRQLVEQRRALRDAAQRGHANERCLAGQRMRRVANGWVQAGAC